jgi:hypothetical protein
MSAAEMARPEPGLAFWLPSDAGNIVGLVTHKLPKIGSLVWIASPTFDEEPTLEDVRRVESWRWPVVLPLDAAIRQRVVTVIGTVALAHPLQQFPTMRSGNRRAGWVAFTEVEGVRQMLGSTDNPSLPIYQVVNDTRLKEMVVANWRPEDVW